MFILAMIPAHASAAEGPEPGSLSLNIDCIGVFQSIYKQRYLMPEGINARVSRYYIC